MSFLGTKRISLENYNRKFEEFYKFKKNYEMNKRSV